MRMLFFFFNDTATTEIYTLSLHDALPISLARYSPTYVCDLHMHLPLLFLLLYIHIVFLISVLYLSLSFHILFVYDILVQILYDICNSICYVLNFEYPFWKIGRASCRERV